jgi:hypothetical protein
MLGAASDKCACTVAMASRTTVSSGDSLFRSAAASDRDPYCCVVRRLSCFYFGYRYFCCKPASAFPGAEPTAPAEVEQEDRDEFLDDVC